MGLVEALLDAPVYSLGEVSVEQLVAQGVTLLEVLLRVHQGNFGLLLWVLALWLEL